jgi:hypothetical protein
VSDQEPDPGEPPAAAAPEPQSEPGAGNAAESFADTAISAAPREFAAGPGEHEQLPTSVGKARRGSSRRVAWTVGLGLGYVVLAAGTAFGVIIDKSPTPVDVTAVNASVYAAPLGSASGSGAGAAGVAATASQGTKSGGATPKASPSPSAAPSTASPTPSAAPTSTVTGSVSDGTHSGDLRYFLLPPPQGPSSVQGDPDGTTETLDDVLTTYTDPSQIRTSLEQDGLKAACTRTYQDSTMGANVTVQLMQFDSSDEASQWLSGYTYNGGGYQSISVSGESGAVGWSYAKDGTYELVGAYHEGDTFFEVTIYGADVIPAQDLGQVISAEHSRLADG